MKLVIFDMDGLMFDTGRLAYRAYLESAKEHNFEMKPDVYYYLTGRNDQGIRAGMEVLYGKESPVNTWRDSMVEYKKKILADEKRVHPKKGLIDLLECLKKKNYLLALASSSSRKTIEYYFQLENMPNYFDTLVSGEELTESKPNPEIFLTACKNLQVNPSEAIVLEDSIVGIEAANRAKIRSILIRDNLYDLPEFIGDARLVMRDFSRMEQGISPTWEVESLANVNEYLERKDTR